MLRTMASPPPWTREWPTVADVNAAHPDTCAAWLTNLPPPQTDVQVTIKRRLMAKVEAHLREKHPDISTKMDELYDMFERVTGTKAPSDWRQK